MLSSRLMTLKAQNNNHNVHRYGGAVDLIEWYSIDRKHGGKGGVTVSNSTMRHHLSRNITSSGLRHFGSVSERRGLQHLSTDGLLELPSQ